MHALVLRRGPLARSLPFGLSKSNKLKAVFFIGILLFCPQVWGCPVCFDANESARLAYYLTTVFLSFFPLAILGLFAWWAKTFLLSFEQDQEIGSKTRTPT
jgi:hypothetical protein